MFCLGSDSLVEHLISVQQINVINVVKQSELLLLSVKLTAQDVDV